MTVAPVGSGRRGAARPGRPHGIEWQGGAFRLALILGVVVLGGAPGLPARSSGT